MCVLVSVHMHLCVYLVVPGRPVLFIHAFLCDHVPHHVHVLELGCVSGPGYFSWASLVAQTVKNPPAMWDTWVGKIF